MIPDCTSPVKVSRNFPLTLTALQPAAYDMAPMVPLPHILKLRRAILKIRRNRFHLVGLADKREDDLAFSSEVFGSAGIGDAVDESSHRAGD